MVNHQAQLQINWICLSYTAGAPVCFHTLPTSYDRDYIVTGEYITGEYMKKGNRNVRCFSQFKNSYGKDGPGEAFFKPLV